MVPDPGTRIRGPKWRIRDDGLDGDRRVEIKTNYVAAGSLEEGCAEGSLA